MQNHVFKLFPSKLYILLILTTLLTSILIFLCLSLSIWLKLPGCLFLLAYGAHLFWSKGLLRGRDAITELQVASDKRFRFYQAGKLHEASLLGDSTVTGWISVLRFKMSGKRFPVSCVILNDSLPADQYRQLLLILKMD
jgi:hypothetical protein